MLRDVPEWTLAEQIRARPTEPVALARPLEVSQLPTPALVVDRAAFESNLGRMAQHAASFGKGLRPHAKTHKCPIVARRQLETGAVGICVAKVSEAVALASAGIAPLLITSPVTAPGKVAVLERLADEFQGIGVVVDSEVGMGLLERMGPANGLAVLVDLDVAMGRTGTRDDDLARRLVERIQAVDHLDFMGFQHYAGHVMHIQGHAARSEASLVLWERVLERLGRIGVRYDVLTGCGTGTFDIDCAVQQITDMQVGSYVFMDEEYRQIGGRHSERFADFEVSLTVACTALSQPAAGAVTVDGGYKSIASDTVPPAVDELPNTQYRFAGDEHGVLVSRAALQSVRLGDVVRVVSPHCDPTVNLHDVFWVLEADGMIRTCWPITARGCTW
ncbi:MAG: hypothetical protein CMQ49_14420 [Gammaproteobacteria bacterium]|nr:hypothetical protein [Gammaproteobacteria bacterium]